jgi:cytidyltransferase-like protein
MKELIVKEYNQGLYINKFQPLHNGHVEVIRTMLEKCVTGIVCIENDPKSQHPWDISDRIEMIERTFGKNTPNIVVLPIPAIYYADNWRIKLLKITDIFRRIQPHDPEVFFSLNREQSFCYENFMTVINCNQTLTDSMVRTEIKGNRSVETLIPLEIIPIIYRAIDTNKL